MRTRQSPAAPFFRLPAILRRLALPITPPSGMHAHAKAKVFDLNQIFGSRFSAFPIFNTIKRSL